MSETFDRDAAFSGAGEVREKHRFDEAALETWMVAHVEGFTPPLQVEQFKGGQSNPTYRLTDGAGKRYVLRRKPPGQTLKSAHAVDREYKVLAGLHPTGFPVARPHALCTDESVIGSMFYVMDCVDGRIFWNGLLPKQSAPERAALYDAMNATIAQLHGIDPNAVGLGDYGRTEGFFERQIARWWGNYEQDKDAAGRIETFERLHDFVSQNVPAMSGVTVAHGDYRIDNMIFHPTEPRVLAVLDWELSTLGDPLSDFAYHCLTWRLPATGSFSGFAGLDLASLGIPDEKAYVAAYCARRGIESIPHFNYYIAFNAFRLAGICHGILGRVQRGTAASAQAAQQGQAAYPLAELGWAAAEAAMRG